MNQALVIQPSAARSTDWQVDLNNPDCHALHVVIDITAAGTGAVTFHIEGIDANGKAYTLLTSASLIAGATVILKVGPGLTAAANLVANDYVPKKVRIRADHTNANPMTYAVGANLIN